MPARWLLFAFPRASSFPPLPPRVADAESVTCLPFPGPLTFGTEAIIGSLVHPYPDWRLLVLSNGVYGDRLTAAAGQKRLVANAGRRRLDSVRVPDGVPLGPRVSHPVELNGRTFASLGDLLADTGTWLCIACE